MGWASKLPFVGKSAPVVSVLRLHGAIAPAARFGRGLDDASLAPLVERAVAPKRLAAIAISINSPGGAPVQSRLIAERLRDAARKKGVPLIAFCEDVAASGGYMIACAADEIFADPASIVGSIGVVSASFGFDQAIARVGVQRRLTTAGEAKARLDPFQPLKADDQAWLADLQARLHRQFIAYVREARGAKLATDQDAAIFSGEAFIGEQALELGLIDGFGRLKPTLVERFGEDATLSVVAKRRGLLERMTPGLSVSAPPAAQIAAAAPELLAEIESAARWSRFGL